MTGRLQRLIEKYRPDPEPSQSPLTFQGLRYTKVAPPAVGGGHGLYRHGNSALLGHNREDITHLSTRAREQRELRKTIHTRRPGAMEKQALDLVREQRVIRNRASGGCPTRGKKTYDRGLGATFRAWAEWR